MGVFAHVSAVGRAGMDTLTEGHKVTFDIVADRQIGKSAAENLQAACLPSKE
jgi:CspA family cold shock protein